MTQRIGHLYLHPFDDDHRCPKCGHSPSDVSWRPVVGEGEQNFLGEALTPQPEHLRHECVRCGYLWATDTADNAAEAASR